MHAQADLHRRRGCNGGRQMFEAPTALLEADLILVEQVDT